jgi:hypothetical protein
MAFHGIYRIYIIFLCLVPFCAADWLSNVLPQPGATPTDQIKCYALPYGGIGFTTHVLTYYTAFMLTLGRSPWRWSRIRHYKTDMWLGGLTFPLTIGPSIITMVRCRSRWVFYLLAAWKLSLSLMLALTAMTTAVNVKRGKKLPSDYAMEAYRTMTHAKDRDEDGYKVSVGRTFLWLSIYGAGTLMGSVGLGVLVHDAWYIPKLRHLSYGFIAVVWFLGLLVGVGVYHIRKQSRFRGGLLAAILMSLVTFGAGAVIYSDWALAIIAGNLVGIPDGNNFLVNFLFWTYFVAKRLPFFSF